MDSTRGEIALKFPLLSSYADQRAHAHTVTPTGACAVTVTVTVFRLQGIEAVEQRAFVASSFGG